MTFLLRLGAWITDHPKSFCAALFLLGCVLGVGIGRKLHQAPASLQVATTASGAAFGREDLTRKTEEGPSKTTTTERDYGEVMPSAAVECLRRSDPAKLPMGLSVAQGVATQPERGPLVKEIVTVTERAGTTTQTHSARESAQSTTQTLKLTQEAGSTPGWALAVGLEGPLSGPRLWRLSVRRKFLGPIWVEGAFTPATRAVGAGIAIEF